MSDEIKKTLRLSDDMIAVIRELVQLSFLTGTNVVDHLRAVQMEEVEGNYMAPTEHYIEEYNKYIKKLEEEVEEKRKAAQATMAKDRTETPSN